MRVLPLGAFVALTLAACGTVKSAIVVDQTQSDNIGLAAIFDQLPVQSFQQSFNNITGARVQLADVGGSGDVTIDLLDSLGNTLASNTIVGANQNDLIEASFGTIPVTPDTTLYLVFSSTNGALGLDGAPNTLYTRGQGGINFSSPPPTFLTPVDFDFTFQTLADNNFTPGGGGSNGTVPEPSSMIVWGLGLAGLAFVVGRRRQPVDI